MAVKRITWRWLLNSFAVIVVIVLAIEVMFAIGISNYYYGMVRQTLRAQADLVNAELARYYEESAGDQALFYNRTRELVAEFSAKEQMELMVLDWEGNITFTSSGFEPDDKAFFTDFILAAGRDSGELIGETGGQRVMSVSYMGAVETDSYAAVRLVVSLEQVDQQITFWIVCMAALGIGVLLMVLFSSSYFLSSIVNPVGEVGETARRIAGGDFGARLERRTNDEIGDLCDTINYMAGKLGEAEQMKNDFISSVSHELRTPLTAIQGWAETLLADDGSNKEMLGKGMSIIIGETSRLSQMVEELLDFSRMQSGRLHMEMHKLDVLAELSEVVLMYTEQAKRQQKTLTYKDDDLIVPVMGDKNRLRQVFVNIIDNAVKYTDPDDAVYVSAAKEGDNLVIQVEDTGIGIRAEDLPRVKTKFFKANSTRRSSGIGLAVADEIIAQHGGTLDVRSAFGEGTTITITLPIYQAQEKEGEPNRHVPS